MKTLTYILSITLILILSSCGNQTQFSPVGTWEMSHEFDLSNADEMDGMVAAMFSNSKNTYTFYEDGMGLLEQTTMGININSETQWYISGDSIVVTNEIFGDSVRHSFYIETNERVIKVNDIHTMILTKQ